MSNEKNQRQPISEAHAEVTIQKTYKRSLTRKNPQTGKSNYPTIYSGKTSIINSNYFEKLKTITESNYRKIR